MRAALFIVTLFLSGCDSPSVEMIGVEPRRVTVGPSTFSVRMAGGKAEAIRTSFEFGIAARGVIARGYKAIEIGTGCQIVPRTFDGDPALMRAEVFCQ